MREEERKRERENTLEPVRSQLLPQPLPKTEIARK